MYDIGRQAFQTLLEAMRGTLPKPRSLILPVELRLRESVGLAPTLTRTRTGGRGRNLFDFGFDLCFSLALKQGPSIGRCLQAGRARASWRISAAGPRAARAASLDQSCVRTERGPPMEMSRREFLGSIPAGVALSAALPTALAAAGPRIGCQTNAWPLKPDDFDLFLSVLGKLEVARVRGLRDQLPQRRRPVPDGGGGAGADRADRPRVRRPPHLPERVRPPAPASRRWTSCGRRQTAQPRSARSASSSAAAGSRRQAPSPRRPSPTRWRACTPRPATAVRRASSSPTTTTAPSSPRAVQKSTACSRAPTRRSSASSSTAAGPTAPR